MDFIIAKTILLLALPLSGSLILMAIGMLIGSRHKQRGKAFIISGVSLLYLLSIRPVSNLIIRPLEVSFSPLKDFSLNSKYPVVVLAGGVKDLSWLGIGSEPSETSLSRLVYGIRLYRQSADSTLIISGGSGDPEKPDVSEADAMKKVAISLGVASKDIIVERDSKNTLENALAIKKLVGKKSILLVTSAYHMKRTEAMFRKIGVNVIPAPSDFLSERRVLSLYSFIPAAGNLCVSTIAFSEYLSFTWYRLTGKL